MKRFLILGLALILAGLALAGCGVFDFTGANAAAASHAQYLAERERSFQVTQQETGETERARAYYAYLASAENARQAAQSGHGTDHNGGITGALSVGVGVGWPVIALLLVGFWAIVACVLWLRRDGR